MQFAFWAILIAAVLPLLYAALSKSGGLSNRAPRPAQAALQGWRLRAHWAQQNSWEAFPVFAAAVIVAFLNLVPQQHMDAAAAVFVLARLAYGVCYVMDWPTARSLVWAVGYAAVLYLFLAAAHLF
ncbi:MAG: MAPEG family protein [Vogesella sp.]|uniref:MAPEG family protein n=1 Tax=Vogesella sp. TaxID=1904252 RepID=UPI00391DDD52